MMRWLVLSLFLIFVVGCSENQPFEDVSVLCSPPYFEFESGECCLDENNNNICDFDEVEKFPEEESLIDVPDACMFGTYFECSNLNIKNDAIFGGQILFDLTFKRYGAAVVTNINFPNISCSKSFEQWSIDDGVSQTPKSFVINCNFKEQTLSEKFVDSEMVVNFIYFEEVRQGIDSSWTGVYDVKNFTSKGHISGSI